jgi:hypothetical protein
MVASHRTAQPHHQLGDLAQVSDFFVRERSWLRSLGGKQSSYRLGQFRPHALAGLTSML